MVPRECAMSVSGLCAGIRDVLVEHKNDVHFRSRYVSIEIVAI